MISTENKNQDSQAEAEKNDGEKILLLFGESISKKIIESGDKSSIRKKIRSMKAILKVTNRTRIPFNIKIKKRKVQQKIPMAKPSSTSRFQEDEKLDLIHKLQNFSDFKDEAIAEKIKDKNNEEEDKKTDEKSSLSGEENTQKEDSRNDNESDNDSDNDNEAEVENQPENKQKVTKKTDTNTISLPGKDLDHEMFF